MYNNIGSKIKLLAKIFAGMGATVSFYCGIVLLDNNETDLILWGLLFLFGGPAASWALSWPLYGFGELVDRAKTEEPCSVSETQPIEPAPQPDPQRLGKLNHLYVSGVITQEEYQRGLANLYETRNPNE